MQADVKEVRCTTGNHHKFYRTYVMYDDDAGEYRTLFNWGRIGANGQYQAHPASSKAQAEHLAQAKLASKLNKEYEFHSDRHLDVVPDDLLERAVVTRDENARSRQAERLAVDNFARFSADADSLIRLVSGPGGLTGEAAVLRSSLQDQLDELRMRLTESEGQMGLINEVIAMKAGV